MRILHTSDWHLGVQLHGVPLLEEQKDMVLFLLETVRLQRVDAVILAGDVFDHAVARPDAILLYNDAMAGLCRNCGAQVFLCAGNHDGAARLSACAELLRGAGLFISGKLSKNPYFVSTGDVQIFLLPWYNTDEVRYLFPDEQIKTASDAMRIVVAQMKEQFEPGKKHLLAAHCFVGGAELSESDRAASVGGASQVASDTFEGFDYVALGHLHRPQKAGENARYSGSPFPYSFAEVSHQKSFTLLDTDTMQLEEIPVHTGHSLRVLKGPLDELLTTARLESGCMDYLKIEMTDACAGLETLELFREFYPNLLLLAGQTPQFEEKTGALSFEELSGLTPRALVEHFCMETAGYCPDGEEYEWFEAAAAAVEEGELQ